MKKTEVRELTRYVWDSESAFDVLATLMGSGVVIGDYFLTKPKEGYKLVEIEITVRTAVTASELRKQADAAIHTPMGTQIIMRGELDKFYAAFAKALGMEISELDDQIKKQAFLAALMEPGELDEDTGYTLIRCPK